VNLTPAGGSVELAVLYHQGKAVIRVSDTGAGIQKPNVRR
jgi:signal transduction histidine kinase